MRSRKLAAIIAIGVVRLLSSKSGGSCSPVFEPERSRALAGAMLELRRKMKLILIADFDANLFNGKGRMKEQRPGGVHLHPNEKR